MQRILRRLVRLLMSAEESIGILFLFLMTVIFFAQIFLRFAFGLPLHWVEEVIIYLGMWAVFVGGSLGARWNNHVELGLWDKIAESKPYLYTLVQCMGRAITSVVCFILAYWQICLIISSVRIKPASPVLGIPNTVPEAGILLGLLGMGIYFLFHSLRLAARLRKGEIPRKN